MERHTMILKTEGFVKEFLSKDRTGHDWNHIERVRNLALHISKIEGGDPFIIELAALLHDVADEKLNPSEEIGLKRVEDWLNSIEIQSEAIEQILRIISTMSFKGGTGIPMESLEGRIVQDADRIDAIGAIGIARCFTYSGAKGQKLFDPAIPVREVISKEAYRNEETTAINHFYEKLLKLQEHLNTKTGKSIGKERNEFMVLFLKQFNNEWNSKY